eukprot:jgi/Tetstr1/436823/TSEL_025601.t1
MGRHFIGVVKTCHGLFPKAFLKSHLTSAPAGSRVALSAIVNGVDLMAVGYKYNMRKVLFFVATAGATVHLGNGANSAFRAPWAPGAMPLSQRHVSPSGAPSGALPPSVFRPEGRRPAGLADPSPSGSHVAGGQL